MNVKMLLAGVVLAVSVSGAAFAAPTPSAPCYKLATGETAHLESLLAKTVLLAGRAAKAGSSRLLAGEGGSSKLAAGEGGAAHANDEACK